MHSIKYEGEIQQFQKVFHPEPKDEPIIDIHNNYEKGNIVPEPEYQRKFIWNKNKQSYFIESIIYGIDTPIIYFVEVEKNTPSGKKIIKETIDGRQRLSTIFDFYENKLKLTGLKENTPFYSHLNDKIFKEIDEKFQKTFQQYAIRTVNFKIVDRSVDIDTQLKFKYQLFHRYNSGLTALNKQEIRNCKYSKDDFHQRCKKIAQSEEFLKVCPFFKDDQRMAGDEYVTLLYLLTCFDDSVKCYAKEDALKEYTKKSKNPFIDKFFERIESHIYKFENDDTNDLDVDEENEESKEDVEINKKLKSQKLDKIEKDILNNYRSCYLIYGKFLNPKARHERYLIETLYYYIAKDKRITKTFISNTAYDLGQFINNELKKIENTPHEEEFNLIDCYKEKPAHTARVKFRFEEMKKIIDKYFKQLR